jgi:hypothetical protein
VLVFLCFQVKKYIKNGFFGFKTYNLDFLTTKGQAQAQAQAAQAWFRKFKVNINNFFNLEL